MYKMIVSDAIMDHLQQQKADDRQRDIHAIVSGVETLEQVHARNAAFAGAKAMCTIDYQKNRVVLAGRRGLHGGRIIESHSI
jgi:hypothetical protein